MQKAKIDRNLLARAAKWLRCPKCGASNMSLTDEGLHCASCGQSVLERDGYLDFLATPDKQLSLAQRMFISKPFAYLYAWLRGSPEIPGKT